MTRFTGPLKAGGWGNDAADGDAVLTQRVSLSAQTSSLAFQVPHNSDIKRIHGHITTAYDATAQASLRFGIAGNLTYFGTVNVSAVSTFEVALTAAAVGVSGASGTVRVLVDVTVVGTAADGAGVAWIDYKVN